MSMTTAEDDATVEASAAVAAIFLILSSDVLFCSLNMKNGMVSTPKPHTKYGVNS